MPDNIRMPFGNEVPPVCGCFMTGGLSWTGRRGMRRQAVNRFADASFL